jgi:hypothetical protein
VCLSRQGCFDDSLLKERGSNKATCIVSVKKTDTIRSINVNVILEFAKIYLDLVYTVS